MTGTVDVFIPRTATGELMTGEVPRGQRKRAAFTPHRDVHTYFDPLADRNLPSAIPLPKARPFNPAIAPKGWRLAPQPVAGPADPQPVAGPAEAIPTPTLVRSVGARRSCPTCGRTDFRANGAGLAWHLDNAHTLKVVKTT